MVVAGLELLVDRVHVAEAALETIGAENRGGARHVIGGADDFSRFMNGRGRGQAQRDAMRFGQGAAAREVVPDFGRSREQIGARAA